MSDPEEAYYYAGLILGYLKGQLTTHEEQVLQAWLDADVKNREFMNKLRDQPALDNELEFFSSLDTVAAWEAIAAKSGKQPVKKRSLPVMKYAAAIALLLLSATVFFYTRQKAPTVAVTKVPGSYQKDLAPGGDKAQLTLADGSVIVLENSGDGLVSTQAGVRISKRDGQLIYEAAASVQAPAGTNTIATPRGGQYQLILPDGTKVWLNASSSLVYPTRFSGRERLVKLIGEAYFEVAKNKDLPFRVQANETRIDVFGTHFNVMAYPDENKVSTTLLEGSVKVSNGLSSAMIVPGQQAVIRNSDHQIRLSDVNADDAIAWKEGIFLFNGEDIQTVMRQVSRWYDVNISYEGNVPSGHFTGKIARSNNVSKVLSLLELTGGVQFKITEREIQVFK